MKSSDVGQLKSDVAHLETNILEYTFGDVLAIVSIQEAARGIATLAEENPTLQRLRPYCVQIERFCTLLRDPESEEEGLDLLRESVSDLRAFLERRISPSHYAAKAKGREARTREGDTAHSLSPRPPEAPGDRGAPAEREDVPAEEPSGGYEEGYFDNIIEDADMLAQFYAEAKDRLNEAQAVLVELEHDPSNPDLLNTIFRSFHTVKGSSAFLGLKNIEELSHAIENLLALLRDGVIKLNKNLTDVILGGGALLDKLLGLMPEQGYQQSKLKTAFAEVDIGPYVQLVKQVQAEAEVDTRDSDVRRTATREALEAAGIQRGPELVVEKKKRKTVVKVSNDKLNMLVDMIGELVINLSILKQELYIREMTTDDSLSLTQLEAITTTIKNIVLSMGMVPIAEIFGKLRVLTRNTAEEIGKSVYLEVCGEDTELDRNVIESIYDPLVHIIRNAVDHGIESQEERKAAGKSVGGTVRLSALHKGSGIEITVEDDGRGIDPERIVAKAVERGILEESEAEGLPTKDIYNLMFLPGFSTAETVSSISGRGVGLDVVKRNIEALHGRVEVQSEQGAFTRFIIRLPLTLAIIDGFVTRVGENKYVFPFNAIEEILVLSEEELEASRTGKESVMFHRGIHVPIVNAHSALREIPDMVRDGRILTLIFSLDQTKYCVIVDELLGKQEIVVKNLSDLMIDECRHFSGGTIFGDGSIGFVIDMQGFVEKLKEYGQTKTG